MTYYVHMSVQMYAKVSQANEPANFPQKSSGTIIVCLVL